MDYLYLKKIRKLNTYVRFEEINSFLKLRKKNFNKNFFEMEPKYRNKVYFKNNKIHVDIKVVEMRLKLQMNYYLKLIIFLVLTQKEKN